MLKGQSKLPIIPVRSEASHRAEQVTQLLYGETYSVLEDQGEFIRIKIDADHYEGWMAKNQYADHVPGQALNVTSSPIQLNEGGIQVPIGSVVDSNLSKTVDLFEVAKQFIGAPYLWGGKSVYGIDCSGFVQVVFKTQGVNLQRDASQQVKQGTPIPFGEHQKGDLAFFSENNKITHVGLLTGVDTILHASGEVKEDAFNEKGILSKQGVYTHQLAQINRHSNSL